jgi:L-arabinose isomerase
MERPRLGLVSVYFSLFDEQMRAGFREEQERLADGYAELLADQLGAEVVYPGLLASDADGDRANELFRSSPPNVLVFAPSMAAPPSYAIRALDGIDAPVVVWNAPAVKRLPGDLTQAEATENSTQVGCVMAANVLVRRGCPFSTVTAAPGDAAGVETLVRTVRAALAASLLRGGTVLRVGDPIAGYLDVEATAEELTQLGVAERAVTIEELDAAFEAVDVGEAHALLAGLDARGWKREPAETDERSARLALALSRLATEADARCGTVNCHGPWLRSNERIGITACLGVSLLTEKGVPFSCTGDQPTGLALLLARALSGRALYCEFYAPELSSGLMLLAAGGEGDPVWADPSTRVRIEPNHHYPGVVGVGASVSFRLEPGPATVLSLSPASTGWRLAWATGEIVETRYPRMGGPNAMFRFDSGSSADAGARWIESGATHHNALAAGRLDVEIPALARALGVEAVRV